ncbi:MAG TPA: serine hydrolase domain-containing protein [Ignavibacteria bacterium]|nr:serine hydrolase domain-containing protein [Ignavibacteria bacterium]
MKKSFLYFQMILILAVHAVFSNACGQDLIYRDTILNKLTELKNESNVKALIAGVWKGDKEIITLAFGESMTLVPADDIMHLRIGGVSETFLGTLLMILAEKGSIRLDEKISKWMPELLAADQVTPEMLIKNTAGYKDYVLNKDFIELITKEPFRNVSRKEIINYSTSGGELNFPPGTDQKYSHTEFTILGEIIERATGIPIYKLYEDNIFKPLGLINTGYSVNSELPSPVLHSFSSDRGIYEDATFWNPSWTGESGPLYSNLHDLGKWGNIFGKGKMLSKEFFEKLIRRPEGAVLPDLYFASGFVVANGWYIQNPSFNGFSGAFGYLPSEELIVVIFTTKSDDVKQETNAFQIFKELIKMITPDSEINF